MTILCSLMSKDQFGVVGPMHMEVETQQTEAKQKELQDFQKSHPSLPFSSLHFFWMLKGQFGPVAEMIVDNWEWEIQQTRPKQRRLQEFLQSKAWQETFIHCFLILKDQFGAVDSIVTENWDWETQQTETKQKRLQDFQKSTQFQQEINLTLSLLMKMEVFGCVNAMQ